MSAQSSKPTQTPPPAYRTYRYYTGIKGIEPNATPLIHAVNMAGKAKPRPSLSTVHRVHGKSPPSIMEYPRSKQILGKHQLNLAHICTLCTEMCENLT